MEKFNNYLQIARSAARQAGNLLMEGYGNSYDLIQREAGHYSIKKDSQVNSFYEDFLKSETPDISLYTEEGTRSLDSDAVWVVDPLDGSYNYRIGLPLFVTQICLLYKREPVVSVIYHPVSGCEFSAVKGQGAFMDGKKISVSDESDIKRSMLLIARRSIKINEGKTMAELAGSVRAVRLFGATGIDLSFIASGKADIAINNKSKLFDYAPGVLLVREAGGVAKNMEGKEWAIDDDNLIASTSQLMPGILSMLRGDS